MAPSLRRLRALVAAVGAIALATLVGLAIAPHTVEANVVMGYVLMVLVVGLLGDRGAAVAAAVLGTLAFDFFFVPPRLTLTVADGRYFFTFVVMVLAGLLTSTLMARLTREGARAEERAAAAEALGAELAEANRALKTLDRLKTDLLSNVSHELRTPLAGVVGNAELLQDGLAGPLSAPQAELVGRIQSSAARLGRMVDYLLDFTRLEAGRFPFDVQDIDVAALTAEAIATARPFAEAAGLSLELAGAADPVPARLDAGRFVQVLGGFLDNAIKFTPRGGRVRVRLAAEADAVTVTVEDTGVGITPEHLPHLFEKFYQVDATSTRATGGAGLGLAFAKAIVEAQQGAVGVLSEPGRGSTFWFTLPRAPAPRAPENATSASRRPC